MALEVLEGGLLTTLQDRGRYGWEQYGVPVAGAMDPFALQAANAIVGNDLGEAALEITIVGPRLYAHSGCLIAVAGADLDLRVDGAPAPTWQALWLPAGSVVEFGGRRSGCRAYLAVAGGFAVAPVLGSRSTYLRGGFGGLDGRALRAGDLLPLRAPAAGHAGLAGRPLPAVEVPHYTEEPTVRVVLGPQADRFTPEGVAALLDGVYEVGPNSDRMGCRLRGPRIAQRAGADIVSDGIALGSVQVPGDGQPIVLMADRQTAGGYTKIATVIGADVPLLAQCVPGASRVRFAAVSLAEAVRWRREQARTLALLAGPRAYRLAGVSPADGEVLVEHGASRES